jgi:methyl-accepting chemotaxis protein
VEQNNLFHAIIRALAESTGHSVEEIKEYVSQEYLGSVEYTGLDGTPRTRVRSTSELDVEEMSGLIERVKQLANQLDVRMEHIEYG